MARRSQRDEQRARSKEVAGIILIVLGVFVGISTFSSETGLLGRSVGYFIYGLFGLAGYLIPFIIILSGVMVIMSISRRTHTGKITLVAGCLLFFVGFLHLLANAKIHVSEFILYMQESYFLGAGERVGGGFLGALLAYPAQYLLGEVGAYLLFITGVFVFILILTNLSLNKAGHSIVERFRSLREPREPIDEETDELGEGLFETKPAPKAKRRGMKQVEGSLVEPIASYGGKSKLLKDSERGIEIFPQKGPLPKAADYPFSLFGEETEETLQAQPMYDEVDVDECIPEQAPWQDTMQTTWQDQAPQPWQDAQPWQEPQPWQEQAQQPPWQEAPKPRPETQRPRPYVKPHHTLLNAPAKKRVRPEDAAEKARLLVDTLASFGVSARVTDVCVGPAITRYELQPAAGVRVNRITNLADDLALSLAAPRVRIEAPIPGKAAIGIEVPNKDTAVVSLRELIECPEFEQATSPLNVVLGKDIAGKPTYADLSRMPHLLIAGSTGSGKSVCINDLIVSIAYKSTPEDVKLILIDPKVVELSVFGAMPHLLVPVVTDPKKAAGALNWAVQEMVKRYQSFAKVGARDLTRYNEITTAQGETKLPYIVAIIDELADLMMVAPNEVEDSICRLAQMGRACGIHLVVATQRPSADIITGLIKANIPSRIAFAVASGTDSRIILDTMGAEKLLGRGDMLFYPTGASKPTRVQGAYVSDVEVERLAEFFQKRMGGAAFDTAVYEEMDAIAPAGQQEAAAGADLGDELMPDAINLVMDSGQASISMIQRRFRVGYARAARIIDIMEQMGVIGAQEGSKSRKILMTRMEAERLIRRDVAE